MKGNKLIKVVIAIAFVLLIIGSICVGVGFMRGGSFKYMSINKNTISWWPFDTDYDFDMDDNHSKTGSSSQNLQLQNDIDNLIVNADLGDIEIIRGNTNKVILNKIDKKYVDIKEKDGVADISIKHDNFYSNTNHEKIIIQLKDKEYKDIQVKSDLGKIKIDDLHSAKFQITAKLGEIEMENIYSNDLYVDQSSGDVDIEGVLLGNSIIKNSLGKIDVEVRGKQNDYRYDVKTSLGKTEIQNEKFNGSASVSQGDKNAKNYLKVNCSVGDVELSFH